jgi:hypothetical protein
MSYSTNTSILILLPGLPQTTTSAGYTSTLALIEDHIARADNVINGKIAKRYDVSGFDTTGSVPPMLITISEDISSFYTYRSLYSSDNQNYNEWMDKFDEAMELLNEIRDGDIDIVNSTGSIIEERTSATQDKIISSTENYQTFFDIDEPTDWKFDDDRKDEVADER